MRTAQEDQKKRTVEVDRLKLVSTLKSNLEKHIADYEEAKAGYRSSLLVKLDEALASAKVSLEKGYEKAKQEIFELTDTELSSRNEWVNLVREINVRMPVPRLYAKEYQAAIDMAEWDVRDTLELTHAEFNCFVRDEWDWREEFETISGMYKRAI